MGGSSTTSKTHATTSTTPQVPGWVQQPYQNFVGQVGQLNAMDPSNFTTGATGNQQQAFANAGNPDPGAGTFAQLMGYQAPQVSAGQIASTDLSPYMNPFQQQVTDATINEFGQGNAIGLNQLRSSTPSGAFNGSRQGVAEGQLTSDNMRTLASTLAGLNSANFANAQSAAGQDIGTRLQAALANQGASQSAAGTRLAAGAAAGDSSRAQIAQQLSAGEQERAINSQNNPNVARLSLLQAIQGLLGQNAQSYIGSSGVADSKTKQTQDPGILGIISTLAQAIGAMQGGGGGNPFALAGGG